MDLVSAWLSTASIVVYLFLQALAVPLDDLVHISLAYKQCHSHLACIAVSRKCFFNMVNIVHDKFVSNDALLLQEE